MSPFKTKFPIADSQVSKPPKQEEKNRVNFTSRSCNRHHTCQFSTRDARATHQGTITPPSIKTTSVSVAKHWRTLMVSTKVIIIKEVQGVMLETNTNEIELRGEAIQHKVSCLPTTEARTLRRRSMPDRLVVEAQHIYRYNQLA